VDTKEEIKCTDKSPLAIKVYHNSNNQEVCLKELISISQEVLEHQEVLQLSRKTLANTIVSMLVTFQTLLLIKIYTNSSSQEDISLLVLRLCSIEKHLNQSVSDI
jgi:hypothetical protein